jgi:hypothetical protein
MIFNISDEYQQYKYMLEVADVGELKHVKVYTQYQGAKFPDAVQSKVEMFLNDREWQKFKDAVNEV